MGNIYRFNSYIVNLNDITTNLYDLGYYYTGLCSLNEGWETYQRYVQIGANEYTFLENLTDDFYKLGGTVATNSNNYNILTQFMPFTFKMDIPNEYINDSYGIKIVSLEGYYAVSSSFTSLGYTWKLYDNNNIMLGPSNLITCNGRTPAESSITVCFACVSELPLSTTTRYIKCFFNTSRYFTRDSSTTSIRTSDLTWFNAIEPFVIDTDPYSGAGDSTSGGGDGTFDGTSDPIPIPTLPSVGAQDSGFITLFAPTTAQLKGLASYCWSNLFDVDTFKKLFNDPMDCILGLSVVPVAVPTSGVREITVGNIITTVSMNVASQQYVELNCGSVSFANKFFGSYLDYEPYTKMSLFVPYSGFHSINADDIMGKTVQLVYHIDILTGSLVAFLKSGDSVLYEFNGACASNIPVNSINYASTIENAVRIAVNIGTTVATAGASAPLSMASEGATAVSSAQAIGRGVSLAGSTAEGALSMKPNIDRSGAMGGATGIMGNQTPYFIITRPRLCKPKNQDKYKGYPSFITVTVSDLVGKGYVEFDTILIESTYLTDSEESELETILKGGVYL